MRGQDNGLFIKRFGLCSVLRPLQHSIGYMGDGFSSAVDRTMFIVWMMYGVV